MDLPVWQELREELKDRNFEVITVACDSKGPEAAGEWIRAANPQHPSLIDTQHRVSELYSTRNVPAAFWIDEDGRIVRANDPIFAQRRSRDTVEVTINETYLNALRDWTEKGSGSIYVQDGDGVQTRMTPPTIEDAQAMAYFRLGVYLNQQGHSQDAVPHFKRAQALRPQNWNYKRQAWNLGNIERDYGTTFQVAREDPASQPFRPPLDLPEPPGS
jgi:hypothetical protein